MPLNEQTNFSPSRFPVSVIMERRQKRHARWSTPYWEVVGVVGGEAVSGQQRQCSEIRSTDGVRQFLWTGFVVELHKDTAESYWYNLVSKTPSLFVICRQQEQGEVIPFLVTANYDEAGAYMEADDTVFSMTMPPEVYQWLEQYVIQNYVPREKKKRKRKNWSEHSVYERKSDVK